MTKEYNPKINKTIYTIKYPKSVCNKDSKYVFTLIIGNRENFVGYRYFQAYGIVIEIDRTARCLDCVQS